MYKVVRSVKCTRVRVRGVLSRSVRLRVFPFNPFAIRLDFLPLSGNPLRPKAYRPRVHFSVTIFLSLLLSRPIVFIITRYERLTRRIALFGDVVIRRVQS